MFPTSQVLIRQQSMFDGAVLLAGAPADQLMEQLPQAQAWCWLQDDAEQLKQRYGERVSIATTPPVGEFSAAVLFLPKSRELTDYLLQSLATNLHGKPLYLVGEKRAGIEGSSKLLAKLGPIYKVDSARHCQLWHCTVENSAASNLANWQQTYSHNGLEIISLPGVFSHGRLDTGSKLLLDNLDNLPSGHWLDFGCGAGIIGATLKHQNPAAQLSLLDVDAFAVASSQLTLAANQLEAEVILGRGIEDAPEGLAAIISNPPFHQGVKTNYQATEQLIMQARQHLRPGGELRIVANNFLKYSPLIEQHLGPCQILAERNGFRVYSAKRAN